MAKRSTHAPLKAAKVAEKEMKGWTAETEEPARAAAMGDQPPPAADDVLPSLTELKRHFLGDQFATRDAAPPAEPGPSTTEVVNMRSGPLRKAVGVNTKTGKVEWRQG